jgi:hypothetical protein
VVEGALHIPEDRTLDWGNAFLDDYLWFNAIRSNDRMDRVVRKEMEGGTESRLWGMVRMGLHDPTEEDKPWDSSTRSMRYSAILTDHLWEVLAKEKKRVRVLI